MKLQIKKLYLSLSFVVISLVSMEQAPRGLTVYAIPGQNGLGSEPEYIQEILQPDSKNQVEIIEVSTPTWGADLGQNNCIQRLSNAIEKQKRQHHNAILYATSQGTATALNYLAHAHNNDPANKIDGLVLEATLASGNSAVHHTVTGPLMSLSNLGQAPFSYYWIPYLAKALMPTYWPGGKQPIKSIEKISTKLPILIIHSKQDPQLSFDDACALYYGLRQSGNENVYLIPFDQMAHIQILAGSNVAAQAVREILTKHKLLQKDRSTDLSLYQPNPDQFKAQYDALITKERIHDRLKYCISAGACAAGFLAIKTLCNYKTWL